MWLAVRKGVPGRKGRGGWIVSWGAASLLLGMSGRGGTAVPLASRDSSLGLRSTSPATRMSCHLHRPPDAVRMEKTMLTLSLGSEQY